MHIYVSVYWCVFRFRLIPQTRTINFLFFFTNFLFFFFNFCYKIFSHPLWWFYLMRFHNFFIFNFDFNAWFSFFLLALLAVRTKSNETKTKNADFSNKICIKILSVVIVVFSCLLSIFELNLFHKNYCENINCFGFSVWCFRKEDKK